ncbi:hypothetical protein AB3M80_18185 [Arthrospira platensis BEA 1257B]
MSRDTSNAQILLAGVEISTDRRPDFSGLNVSGGSKRVMMVNLGRTFKRSLHSTKT